MLEMRMPGGSPRKPWLKGQLLGDYRARPIGSSGGDQGLLAVFLEDFIEFGEIRNHV
jgi:hypothetical protein